MAKTQLINNSRNRLLSLMPENGVCAEVGAWKGDFTAEILEKKNPNYIYIIDPYKHFGEFKNAWYGGGIGEQEKMDLIYEQYRNRFKSALSQNKLKILRDTSAIGISKIEENSLDWIYIDGNHTYDFVLEDLELSYSKVKVGGYITGDDYNLVGWWDDGVTKAVLDFAYQMKDKVKLVFVDETQFAFIKNK